MSFYEEFARSWRLPRILGVGRDFEDGFFVAAALFLTIFLVLLLVKRLVSEKHGAAGIRVEGSKGNLFVTVNAVREFVARILQDFEGLRLKGLKLHTSGKKVTIVLEVGVVSANGLPALRDAVQARVIEEAQGKLGLERSPKVDLKIRSLKLEHSSPEPFAPTREVEPSESFPEPVSEEVGPDEDEEDEPREQV